MTPLRLAVLALLVWLGVGCTPNARIEGESEVPEKALLIEARRPLNAYAGQDGQQTDLIDAAEAMRARYDREGYPDADVTPLPGHPPTFRIVAGPRVSLGDVTCGGDLGLAEAALIADAALGPWYTSGTAATGRSAMLRALRTAGHLQATVAAPVITWNSRRTRVDLHYKVQAGPCFRISRSELELVPDGDPAGRWKDLEPGLAALLDPPGTICQPRTPAVTAVRLRGLLLDRGHLDATVEIHRQPGTEPGELHLRYAVQPGPVHMLRTIAVRGGRRSAPSFVHDRLVGLLPDLPLAQQDMDRSISSLLSTGLYRRAEVVPTAGTAQADGTVPDDVEVRLQELPAQHVDISVGYGTYERWRGGVAYADDHALGRGLQASTGVDVSTVGWAWNSALVDPFILGPGRRIGLDVVLQQRQEPSYATREASAGLTYAQRFRPAIDPAAWEHRLGYRFSRSQNYRIEATEGNEDTELLYTTSTLSAELSRDTRAPRTFDPEDGTRTRVGMAWSAIPLGATIDYAEFSGEWSGAWSPADWLVCTARGLGTTRKPGVVEDLPIGERLFLGGSNTVRSFAQDELGPRSDGGASRGGLTSAVVNLELRWRLLPEHREIEVATFYDVGSVDRSPWRLGEPWGEGVGAGLRYRTPVGPIRFDAAYPPGETFGSARRWVLNLTVGFAF